MAPRDAGGARRHRAVGIRRDVRSALPDLGLCVRLRGRRRGAVRRRAAGHDLFAAAEPDRADARGADRADGGRRGVPDDGVGHGGDDRGVAVPARDRRPCRRGPRGVRVVPLAGRYVAAQVRHHDDGDRRARSASVRRRDQARDQGLFLRNPRQPDDGHRRPGGGVRRSRASAGSCRWSTMPSPRRCCSARSNSAPMSSPIRRPS